MEKKQMRSRTREKMITTRESSRKIKLEVLGKKQNKKSWTKSTVNFEKRDWGFYKPSKERVKVIKIINTDRANLKSSIKVSIGEQKEALPMKSIQSNKNENTSRNKRERLFKKGKLRTKSDIFVKNDLNLSPELSRKSSKLEDFKLKSKSSVLKFENYNFKTIDMFHIDKLPNIAKIDSFPRTIDSENRVNIFSTMQVDKQPQRRIRTAQPSRTKNRLIQLRQHSPSRRFRKIDKSPEIGMTQRISTCLKHNSQNSIRKVKRKKVKSIVTPAGSLSLLAQDKREEAGESRKRSSSRVKIRARENRFWKDEPTRDVRVEGEGEATAREGNSEALKHLEMPKIVPEKVKEIEGNRRHKELRKRRETKDRFAEFQRMRSPKKKSLFEEYQENMRFNLKPISLKTYYKIPKNSQYLKRESKLI